MASPLVNSSADLRILSPAKGIIEIEEETGLARFIDMEEDDYSCMSGDHILSADDSLSPMSETEFTPEEDCSAHASIRDACVPKQTDLLKHEDKDEKGIFRVRRGSADCSTKNNTLVGKEEAKPLNAIANQVRTIADSESAVNDIHGKTVIKANASTCNTIYGRMFDLDLSRVGTAENVSKNKSGTISRYYFNPKEVTGNTGVDKDKVNKETCERKSLETKHFSFNASQAEKTCALENETQHEKGETDLTNTTYFIDNNTDNVIKALSDRRIMLNSSKLFEETSNATSVVNGSAVKKATNIHQSSGSGADCLPESCRVFDLCGRRHCRNDKHCSSHSYIVANSNKNLVTYKKVADKSENILKNKGTTEKCKDNVNVRHIANRFRSKNEKSTYYGRNIADTQKHFADFGNIDSSKHNRNIGFAVETVNDVEAIETDARYKNVVTDRDIEDRFKTVLKGRYIKVKLKDVMKSGELATRTYNTNRDVMWTDISSKAKTLVKGITLPDTLKTPLENRYTTVRIEEGTKGSEIATRSKNNDKKRDNINKSRNIKAKHKKNKKISWKASTEPLASFNCEIDNLSPGELDAVKAVCEDKIRWRAATEPLASFDCENDQLNSGNLDAVKTVCGNDAKDEKNHGRCTRTRKKTAKALALEQLEKSKRYRRYLQWFMRQQNTKKKLLVNEKGKGDYVDVDKKRRKLDDIYELNESESAKRRRLHIKKCINTRFHVKQYSLSQRWKQRKDHIHSLKYQKPHPVLLIKATWNYWRTLGDPIEPGVSYSEETGVGLPQYEEPHGPSLAEKISIPNIETVYGPYIKTEIGENEMTASEDQAVQTEALLDAEENEPFTIIKAEPASPSDSLAGIFTEQNEPFIITKNEPNEPFSVVEENESFTVIRNEPLSPDEPSIEIAENEPFTVTRNKPSEQSSVVEENESFTVIRNEPMAPGNPFLDIEESEPYTTKTEPLPQGEEFTGVEENGSLTADERYEACTSMASFPSMITYPVASTYTQHNRDLLPQVEPVDTVQPYPGYFGMDVITTPGFSKSDLLPQVKPLDTLQPYPGYIGIDVITTPGFSKSGIGTKIIRLGPRRLVQSSDSEEEIDVVSVDNTDHCTASLDTMSNSPKDTRRRSMTNVQHFDSMNIKLMERIKSVSYLEDVHNYCIPTHNMNLMKKPSEPEKKQKHTNLQRSANIEPDKLIMKRCIQGNRNINERNRRSGLKGCFRRLKDLIPELVGNEKASKQLILWKAFSLIKYLNYKHDRQVKKLSYLKAKQRSLSLTLKALCGVPVPVPVYLK